MMSRKHRRILGKTLFSIGVCLFAIALADLAIFLYAAGFWGF